MRLRGLGALGEGGQAQQDQERGSWAGRRGAACRPGGQALSALSRPYSGLQPLSPGRRVR